MNPDLEKLLSQVYELEGLLLVIDRHKGDISPFIYEMVQKKVARINELAPAVIPAEECTQIDNDTDIVPEDTTPPEDIQDSADDDYDTEDDFEDAPQEEADEELDIHHESEDSVQKDDDVSEEEELSDDDIFEEPLKLDEALQRSISKDLSKAFSLNDRFRYRRELFGNSEVEMRNTLNMVEAMHSFSEAEEYFYGELEWDSESPEVMDFMTIIRNHFL